MTEGLNMATMFLWWLFGVVCGVGLVIFIAWREAKKLNADARDEFQMHREKIARIKAEQERLTIELAIAKAMAQQIRDEILGKKTFAQ